MLPWGLSAERWRRKIFIMLLTAVKLYAAVISTVSMLDIGRRWCSRHCIWHRRRAKIISIIVRVRRWWNSLRRWTLILININKRIMLKWRYVKCARNCSFAVTMHRIIFTNRRTLRCIELRRERRLRLHRLGDFALKFFHYYLHLFLHHANFTLNSLCWAKTLVFI